MSFGTQTVFSQATYESVLGSGNSGAYDDASSWTLSAGSAADSDGDGIPDSNDNVTITVNETITVDGNFSVVGMTNRGTLSITGSGSLNISGNLLMSGTCTISGTTGQSVIVNGSMTIDDVAAASFGAIDLTISGDTNVNGAVEFLSTIGDKQFGNVDVSVNGEWNNGTVSENFTMNGNLQVLGTFTSCPNTSDCEYTFTSTSGSIAALSSFSIPDIVINGTAAISCVSFGGTLTVTDRITGTGTFTMNAGGRLEYTGDNSLGTNFDITNFSADNFGNTVTFNGSTDQIVRTTTSADNEYYNLILNNSTGDFTLAGNTLVSGFLTMIDGHLELNTNRLTMGTSATINGGSSTNYIKINSTGIVRKNITNVAEPAVDMPIGDAVNYSPINSFDLTGGTINAGAYVEFNVVDDGHPNRNTFNTDQGGDDLGLTAVDYIERYWQVSQFNITDPVFTMICQYIEGDVIGSESAMFGTVYREVTVDMNTFNDWLVAGEVDGTANTITFEDNTSFGDFTAMDNDNERLPIVLVSFEAEPEDGKVKLEWVTASEENNSFFTIERSQDASGFEPILQVAGAGNSTDSRQYTSVDETPPSGRSYYRLKQTDFNGQFTYSEVVSVVNDREDFPLSVDILSNPVERGHSFYVRRNNKGAGFIELRSTSGHQAFSQSILDSDDAEIGVEVKNHLQPGIYVVIVHQRGQVARKKIVVN